MAEEPNYLDLELWLDQQIIPRQNRLKAKFWEILNEVANSIDSTSLLKVHPESRGVKLTKGNDLLGYPYQVLDIIRDFDFNNGLNIRLLNWFGHGLFLFVQLGTSHPKAPLAPLLDDNWLYDTSSSPWDYPEILLNGSCSSSPTASDYEHSNFHQWHKSIQVSGDKLSIEDKISDELKKLIHLLS
ncbi:hypothetical protein [Algoriphagus chordae]|uniref:Uncharacterized protein n=1 Tax=Algoriphagus chordae TaxID=237019 RepID=A0A2W7QPS6_9BACT|nr:hypothetical protein [Algoriphagus chordae]PZX50548.1 hypothetical protein LV85_02655 [Algoriphagus chordae]